MNFSWNIRLIRGPLRPFLVQKAVDALRERLLLSRLRRLPTPWNVDRTILTSIASFPSEAWMRAHGHEVLTFARAMRDGATGLPQIPHWHVGDPDPEHVDVRVIHELSRMHHWCAYALAAHIDTADADRWCDLLASEIESFAGAWPAERGTHWAFPMGTALRVHVMLVAWDWARRTGWTSDATERRVAALALDHAESIWVRRERRGGLSTSHYAANLLGLLAVARYLPSEAHADTWGRFAARELRRELRRQILNDGMSNEASTGYHRQIVDTFVHARALLGPFATIAGWTSHDDVRLDRAVARCAYLEKLGMPLIGDNDDGMAMKLTGLHADCSYMYDLVPPIANLSSQMSDFGLYAFDREHMRVTLRSGPVGQFGKGGHAHQDQNSITVSVDGRAFIVDPGTSVYTQNAAQRNAERHVSSHATMWWPGADQLDAPPGADGLFWLLDDRVQSKVTSITEHQIDAEVAGRSGRRHRRRVVVADDAIEVWDSSTGGGLTSVWFPLHPDVTVEHLGDRVIMLRRDGVCCELTWSAGELAVESITIAPGFGRRIAAHRLTIQGVSDLHWTLQRRA